MEEALLPSWSELSLLGTPLTSSSMKVMYVMARRRVSMRLRRFSYAKVGTCGVEANAIIDKGINTE